jgi:DNA repair ATPase RecN
MNKTISVFLVLLFLGGLYACDNGKKKRAERIERARQDSLWKAKFLPIVLEKPALRPNAVQVLDSWPSLKEFDAYLNRYVKLNRGEAVQGIDELVEATETLFEGYVPKDANIPHIRSRMNLLRNFILKYQDNLLDANISDSTLQKNLAEIKSAYLGIYTQLNKVNQFNPNQELLDTIE